MGLESLTKLIFCEFSGLQEQAVHALPHFGAHMPINDLVFELVEVNNGLREHMEWGDVLIAGQIAAKIKIFQVDGHEVADRGAYDAVEKGHSRSDVGGLGGFITWVINAVAASSPADTLGVDFLWAVGADSAYIGGFFTVGNLRLGDKK